ncbi:hypothetical protein B0H21DRAFT_894229 [Amylocystis lapponica]|nr:hypothetical protein B0H21DRAFT_894229 [Amylocystis lapponica]
MQRTLVPTSATPAEFIVPEKYAHNLCYVPIEGDPMKASTLLPTMYFFDLNLRPRNDWKWIPSYGLHTPLYVDPAESKVFVRRFNENTNEFGPWLEGESDVEETSRRLAGIIRSFDVRFRNEAGQKCREVFLPYLRELSAYPAEHVPLNANTYRQLRLCLNLVYIPIFTDTRGMWPNQPERDKTVVYYTGQVLWVDPTWTEYHVYVLNGAYTGLVMRSLHVCAYTVTNAAAIQRTPHVCVFDRLPGPLIKEAMLYLPVESTKRLVLPVGHGWTTRDELKKLGLIGDNLEGLELDRATYVRATIFDKLAEHYGHPEWYDGDCAMRPRTYLY